MHQPKYVGAEYGTNPLAPLAAGKTGQPEVLTDGGAKAVGKIVFTGNLIAGDTVTVNSKVFTAMASGAAGEFQFNVDISLSASLDALVTALNACTDPLVSYATYTKTDANTAVTSTSDNYAEADNVKLLASNHATVVVTQPTGGMEKRAVSLDTESTQISVAAERHFTLAAGDDFQRKTILNSGAGDAVIAGDFTGSGVTLTLNTNEYLSAQWLAGEWKTVVLTGAIT